MRKRTVVVADGAVCCGNFTCKKVGARVGSVRPRQNLVPAHTLDHNFVSNMTTTLTSYLSKTNSIVSNSLRPTVNRLSTSSTGEDQLNGGNGSGDGGGEEFLVINYLRVKNDILLSYLVDLTLLLRHRLSAASPSSSPSSSPSKQQRQRRRRQQKIESCKTRLQETKVILERIRPMEKKMRYQIDKLLALSSVIHANSSSGGGGGGGKTTGEAGMFAAVGREKELTEETMMEGDANDNGSSSSDDPLSFKPDLQGMMNMFENDDNDDNDVTNDDEVKDYDGVNNKIFLEKKDGSNDDNNNNIYQPPRHQSMPFDQIDSTNQERLLYKKQQQLNKQRARALRSELTHVIKSSILTNDQPDEEDVRGGALVGYQSIKSRKLVEREKEVQEYEERQMIRLAVGKKERKARKRMMREEMSNLGAIADGLGMSRDVEDAFGGNGNGGSSRDYGGKDDSGSYKTTGMRKRRIDILEGGDSSSKSKKKRKTGATNTYQKSLYGGGSGGGGSSKSKKKR